MSKRLFSGRRIIALLSVLAIVLGLTAVYFAYELETQAGTASNEIGGIPKSSLDNCWSTNYQNNRPSLLSFQQMLPSGLKNATVDAFGSTGAMYWPGEFNSTNYELFEIWNVSYILSTPSQRGWLLMLYVANCNLTSS